MDDRRARKMAAALLRATARGARPHMSPVVAAAVDRVDSAVFADLVAAQGMAPWVVAALDDAGRAELATNSGLRQAAAVRALRGIQLEYELKAIVAAMAAHDAPCIVLKGPAVAQRYYPSPELRPYGDLDLLIRHEDEGAVHALLAARGYAQTGGEHKDPVHHDHAKFQSIFQRPDGCTVDVHLDHLQIGLRPLTLDEVWDRAVPSPWLGRDRVLDPHDQFVLLAVHLQRHGFERLLWFKDLDLMIRSAALDWGRVAETARLEGCLSAVGYALLLTAEMLGTPLPEGARDIVASRSALSKVSQALLWPRSRVLSLYERPKWHWRRAIQFAPETGILRGGLPSLLTWGRRGSKARVLLAAVTRRERSE